MKTNTSCSKCAHAETCPAYDPRMMYGFCRGFEVKVEQVDGGLGGVDNENDGGMGER